MISPKKIIQLASKWKNQAAMGRRRISLNRSNRKFDVDSHCDKASLAEKGHFVVYTVDQKRFMFPLEYLSNNTFQELLKLSEEEFGLSCDEPITLPCDATFMVSLVSLLKQGVVEDLDKAFLDSVINSACTYSASFSAEPLLVPSY